MQGLCVVHTLQLGTAGDRHPAAVISTPTTMPSKPYSQSDYDKHRLERAQERARRGLPTFTRSEVRERVMGQTEGENALQQTHRRSQIQRKKK